MTKWSTEFFCLHKVLFVVKFARSAPCFYCSSKYIAWEIRQLQLYVISHVFRAAVLPPTGDQGAGKEILPSGGSGKDSEGSTLWGATLLHFFPDAIFPPFSTPFFWGPRSFKGWKPENGTSKCQKIALTVFLEVQFNGGCILQFWAPAQSWSQVRNYFHPHDNSNTLNICVQNSARIRSCFIWINLESAPCNDICPFLPTLLAWIVNDIKVSLPVSNPPVQVKDFQLCWCVVVLTIFSPNLQSQDSIAVANIWICCTIFLGIWRFVEKNSQP